MNPAKAPLTIHYAGDGVKVDPGRITGDLFVPNLGRDGALDGDELPGSVAAELFVAAESLNALVVPDGLVIECYGDDDENGGGFILAAYPGVDHRAGVTCGWRDAENLARSSDDDRADNDPTVVRDALNFMAAEINAALSGT
ncbi:MAG TPA: hypothetical protein VIJ50_10100 [Solirubrobacteraceae bacterium]|jgi:hypothetical protein